MKLNGKSQFTNYSYAVIARPPLRAPVLNEDGTPRLDSEGQPLVDERNQDIIFKAKAVLNYDPFNQLCPEPVAPLVSRVGGENYRDVENPKYKEKLLKWLQARQYWMILQSLTATEGLTWDTVNPSEPETYGNFATELKEAQFNQKEINLIIEATFEANSLDDSKLKAARERFLRGLPVPQES